METEKVISNYCSNLNKIVDYLKGKQADLKDLEDLRLAEGMLSGRLSEININIELLRNVERIKGSEVLASLKSRVADEVFDQSNFNSSIMRDTLKSNRLRKDYSELENELEDLKKLHKYEQEPIEKFIDVVQGKLDHKGKSKKRESYELKSFAEIPSSKIEESIEMLLIKRLAVLESKMPSQLTDQFKQAKHTLGTIMIDYINKIEQLDLLVVSNKEQNESLKGKMDSLMNEVRNRRKLESLGQERYMHLYELLNRQQEISKREIKNLQEKLELTRSQITSKFDDYMTDYELITSEDTLEHSQTLPYGQFAQSQYLYESDRKRQATPAKFDNEHQIGESQVGFESYMPTQDEVEHGQDDRETSNWEISPDGEKVALQMPPLAGQLMESREEGGTFSRKPRGGKKANSQINQMRLPKRLTTIDSLPEEATETPRHAQRDQVEDELAQFESEEFEEISQEPIQKAASLKAAKKIPFTPGKNDGKQQGDKEAAKETVKVTPDQLLVKLRQLEIERAKGLQWLSKLDSRNRLLERKCQELSQDAEQFRKRENNLVTAYNKFYDRNKSLVRDHEIDSSNFHLKYDQMLKEFEQLKKADKSTVAELQNELNKCRLTLDRVFKDAKYFRDQCVMKDTQLRKLFVMTQGSNDMPASEKEQIIREKELTQAVIKAKIDTKLPTKETSGDIEARQTDESRADYYSDKNFQKATKPTQYYYPEDPYSSSLRPAKQLSNLSPANDTQTPAHDEKIASLRHQLMDVRMESSNLTDENQRLKAKCKAQDKTLEDMAENNGRELTFVYIRGKPVSVDQVVASLETNESSLSQKTAAVEKWQRAYVKMENLCDQLDSECRQLRRKLGETGIKTTSPQAKISKERPQKPDSFDYENQTENRSPQREFIPEESYKQEQSRGGISPNTKLQRTVEDLRNQLFQEKREKKALEEELLKQTNRCKAVDKILEDSLTSNKDRELPFIYVQGKPVTGEQIFAMLATNDEISKKKDVDVELWQHDYLALVNYCDQLEREFQVLKQKLVRAQSNLPPTSPVGSSSLIQTQNTERQSPSRIERQAENTPEFPSHQNVTGNHEHRERFEFENFPTRPALSHDLVSTKPLSGQSPQKVDRSQIIALEAKIAELTAQKETSESQRQTLESQKKALESQKTLLESQKSTLEAQKSATESERQALINRLAGSSSVQEGLTKQLQAYEDNIAALKLQLTASQERSLQQLAELLEIKKEAASQKLVNAQVMAASERSEIIRREKSPRVAQRTHHEEIDFLEEESLEQIIFSVGKENEDLKEKIRRLENEKASLIQEKELFTSTSKGKDSKISELFSECNNKDAQIKNLVDQYTKTTGTLAEVQNSIASFSPKRRDSVGVQVSFIVDNTDEMQTLKVNAQENGHLIEELKETIRELKEELSAKAQSLEEVRKTLSSIFAKKQYLINLVLGLDEDIYVGGRPLRTLDEKSLDLLLDQALDSKRSNLQSRNSLTLPTKSSLSVINIKPPLITREGQLSSSAAPVVDHDALGRLNQEVMRLGEDNRSLRDTITKYVEREEMLKAKLFQIIDHNSEVDLENSDFYLKFHSEINQLDNDMDGFLIPMNYNKVFELLDFLNSNRTRRPIIQNEVENRNQEVFAYQNPPEISSDDDLLIQVLKRNEECQKQIKELLMNKIVHNRSALSSDHSMAQSNLQDQRLSHNVDQNEQLKRITQSLEEFVSP